MQSNGKILLTYVFFLNRFQKHAKVHVEYKKLIAHVLANQIAVINSNSKYIKNSKMLVP